MTVIPTVGVVIRVVWLVVEYLNLRPHQVRPTRNWDRQSARFWDVANLLEPFGLVLGFVGIGRIETAASLIKPLGLALLVVGITIRWTAIRALGKYFTSTVVIKEDHRLIRSGLYKHVRHPAYTGALVAHLGLGLCFSNWFSLAFSSIPYFVAAFYRMRVEDQALRDAFGDEYLEYSTATKRLIPKVY